MMDQNIFKDISENMIFDQSLYIKARSYCGLSDKYEGEYPTWYSHLDFECPKTLEQAC